MILRDTRAVRTFLASALSNPAEEHGAGRIEDMPGPYNKATNDEELEGKHCDACGEWLEPGRTWCPTCGSDR